MIDTKEKRQSPRYNVRVPVKVLEIERLVGALIDVSKGGFRLKLFNRLVDSDAVNPWTGDSEPEAVLKELSNNLGEIYQFDLDYLGHHMERVYVRLAHIIKRNNELFIGLKYFGVNSYFQSIFPDAFAPDKSETLEHILDILNEKREVFHTIEFPEINYTIMLMAKEIDNLSIKDFQKSIGKILDDNKTNIILDFRSTTFVNSLGIGNIYAVAKRVIDAGNDIKLIHLAPSVNKIMSIVGLTKKIATIDNELEYIKDVWRNNGVKNK